MSPPLFDGRPVRVMIDEIAIAAASPLQARRLADALSRELGRNVHEERKLSVRQLHAKLANPFGGRAVHNEKS